MRQVARKIVALRAEQGYTQLDLALIAEVSRNQVVNIERAKDDSRSVGYPRFDTMYKLAWALRVTLEELVHLEIPED